MNITNILQQQAQNYPDSPAIIDKNKQIITFAELERLSSSAATLMRQTGIKFGDAVLVFQPMSIELYIALIGLFRIGAIATFLDPAAGRSHIERCCQLYPPQALIANSKAHLLRFISSPLQQIPIKFYIGFPIPGATSLNPRKINQPDPEIAGCSPETPALLTFTSGSTGQPKAAIRTHGFLLAQHQALAKSLQLKAGEIDLTTLPIFLLANLASGVTSIIPNADLKRPGFINPVPIIHQIQTYQPNRTAASPAFLERLAEYCQKHHLKLTQFEKIFSGGAPVFPHLIQKLNQIAPQAKMITVYGSTEAEPIAHFENQPNLNSTPKMGLCVGQPVAEIQLKILKNQWGKPLEFASAESFSEECLPLGEVGEIVVKGNHVLSGYLNGLGDAETKFNVAGDRWHRTGDAGYLDAQGNLWLVGRCNACTTDQYGILYPFAIESIANQFPFVRRAAAISEPGKRTLWIEPEPHTPIDLESLKNTLAWAKIESIQVCPKIPVDRRHNAKIDYSALSKLRSIDPG